MKTTSEYLRVLHIDTGSASVDEMQEGIVFIEEVRKLDGAARDTLRALFRDGPLYDGDIPSKRGRDRLLALRYASKAVVNGEEGYQVCTYLGAQAYRLIEAGLGN